MIPDLLATCLERDIDEYSDRWLWRLAWSVADGTAVCSGPHRTRLVELLGETLENYFWEEATSPHDAYLAAVWDVPVVDLVRLTARPPQAPLF